jgi:hypothetical protein
MVQQNFERPIWLSYVWGKRHDATSENVTDIECVSWHDLRDLGPTPLASSGARGGTWDDHTRFVTDPVVHHVELRSTRGFTSKMAGGGRAPQYST